MADFPSIGGDSLLQQFLQQQQVNKSADEQDKAADEQKDDQVQRAIQRRANEHKQQIAQHHAASERNRESFTQEQRGGRAWQQLAEGKQGPELMQLAQAPGLQQKLNDKVRAMFVEAAQQDPPRAAAAADAMVRASNSPGFAQAAPNARMASELAAKLLQSPNLRADVGEAMGGKFMRSADGDAGAKQGLLRFASRQVNLAAPAEGISVKMGSDLLEGLRQARVPNVGQRAAMDMMERAPANRVGVEAVDKFVREPAVSGMPAQARGEAVKTLAKGDGAPPLAKSLTDVAGSDAFRGMGREDKVRLYATIGSGRASDLRGIADKTLESLRSGRFPTEPRQVTRFLGGLERAIQKGEGTDKQVSSKGLLRAARSSEMTKPPQLQPIAGKSDEEADLARRNNRSALMGYYSKLGAHYDYTEKEIAAAKHFLQANKIQGVKVPQEPDLSALGLDAAAMARVDQRLGPLGPAEGSRQLPRIEQIQKLRTLQASVLGQQDLSADEKTYALAKTQQAMAMANFAHLSSKKARRVRDLRNTMGKPEPAIGRGARERRPDGVQQRYFSRNADAPAGRPPVRMPGANAEGAGRGPAAGAPRPGAAAMAPGATRALATAARAPLAAGAAGERAAVSRADVKRLVAELDPKLSLHERIQQATEMISQSISQRMQAEMRQATTLLAEALGGQEAAGEAGTGARPADGKPAITTGQSDRYGIPRSAERDLGARRDFRAVRPPGERTAAASGRGAAANESPAPAAGRHRDIVKSSTPVRSYDELYGTSFKDMSRGETALLRSLDWDAAHWASKDQPNAQWPAAYQKSYGELSQREQQAVRQLKIAPDTWDAQAAALRGR